MNTVCSLIEIKNEFFKTKFLVIFFHLRLKKIILQQNRKNIVKGVTRHFFGCKYCRVLKCKFWFEDVGQDYFSFIFNRQINNLFTESQKISF